MSILALGVYKKKGRVQLNRSFKLGCVSLGGVILRDALDYWRVPTALFWVAHFFAIGGTLSHSMAYYLRTYKSLWNVLRGTIVVTPRRVLRTRICVWNISVL